MKSLEVGFKDLSINVELLFTCESAKNITEILN